MKNLSNWRSVRLWETALERDLHQRHSLRTHGLLIGSFTLLLMWGVSALQMHLLHVDSLALRYLITLGAGYVGYLAVLRWWAQRLVEGRADAEWTGADTVDAVDLGLEVGTRAAQAGSSLLDFSAASFDLGGADEGAIVVVPVVAIFLIGGAIFFGAGTLALLYFGWDALLAVAVELAFSYVSARAAVRVAREGWLQAAVRLTWKPLLGALLCAVLLGAAIDHFLPHVNSLPQAVRAIGGR